MLAGETMLLSHTNAHTYTVQIEQDLSVPACGDGVITAGEFCDDMNLGTCML
jgi:hypothetical protein